MTTGKQHHGFNPSSVCVSAGTGVIVGMNYSHWEQTQPLQHKKRSMCLRSGSISDPAGNSRLLPASLGLFIVRSWCMWGNFRCGEPQSFVCAGSFPGGNIPPLDGNDRHWMGISWQKSSIFLHLFIEFSGFFRHQTLWIWGIFPEPPANVCIIDLPS